MGHPNGLKDVNPDTLLFRISCAEQLAYINIRFHNAGVIHGDQKLGESSARSAGAKCLDVNQHRSMLLLQWLLLLALSQIGVLQHSLMQT